MDQLNHTNLHQFIGESVSNYRLSFSTIFDDPIDRAATQTMIRSIIRVAALNYRSIVLQLELSIDQGFRRFLSRIRSIVASASCVLRSMRRPCVLFWDCWGWLLSPAHDIGRGGACCSRRPGTRPREHGDGSMSGDRSAHSSVGSRWRARHVKSPCVWWHREHDQWGAGGAHGQVMLYGCGVAGERARVVWHACCRRCRSVLSDPRLWPCTGTPETWKWLMLLIASDEGVRGVLNFVVPRLDRSIFCWWHIPQIKLQAPSPRWVHHGGRRNCRCLCHLWRAWRDVGSGHGCGGLGSQARCHVEP
jgi:hypothetical protein